MNLTEIEGLMLYTWYFPPWIFSPAEEGSEVSQPSVKVSEKFFLSQGGRWSFSYSKEEGRTYLGTCSMSTVCVGLFLHRSESCPK